MHKLSIRSVLRAIQLQVLTSSPFHLKLVESVHDSKADDILNAIVTGESVGADVEGDIVGFADMLGDSVISHTPQLIGHLFVVNSQSNQDGVNFTRVPLTNASSISNLAKPTGMMCL